MFSFSALLLACYVGSAWSGGAPRLDVGSEVVVDVIDNHEDIQLRCEGSKEVFWTWSSELIKDYAEIETEVQENSDYPHVSTLTVRDPISIDTGFYRCQYNTITDLETDTDNVASTYVYVYEGSIFVKSDHSSMRVKTKEKMVLSCRTTQPNATVTLQKDGLEVTSHTVWNPKIGFVKLGVKVQDTGFYMCTSESTGEVQSIQVIVQPASMELQPPSIDLGPNPHFVVGQPFTLTCTHVKGSLDTVLHWSYPNTEAKYPTNSSKTDEEDNRSIGLTLMVPKASEKDSGDYTCKATAPTYDPSSDSLNIQVKDKLQPYVRIVSNDKINVNESDTLRWKAEVFSFPPNPRIQYINYKGDVLLESRRISMVFDPAKAFAWLIIYNITSNDYGNYTLLASTKDNAATNNFTVNIEVKSSPLVEVKGVPTYLSPGSTKEVICSAQGFPVPTIEWEFQSCPNGPTTCSPYEDIKVGEASLSHPAPGNLVEGTMSLKASSSGYLRCSANNSLGEANNTVSISVSDLSGLHVLRHTGLNITTDFPVPSVQTIITNDDFLLLCAANKLHYKNVTLRTPQNYRYVVHETDSKYSLVREVALQVTKTLAGEYSCVAEKHDNRKETKTVTFKVLEEAEVKFLQDSNMGRNKTVTVKENEPYLLNCTVAGIPNPTVTWKKDGKPLNPGSKFFDGKTVFLSADHERLELKYVFKEKHVGVYTCMAENRVNTIKGRLHLTILEKGLSTTAKVGLVIAFVGIAVLIIIVVVLFRRVKTERRFRKSFRANELYLFEKGNIGQLNPDCSADEQAELLPYGQEWEVHRDRITLGKQLGSGAFGRVVKASVTGLEGPATTTVAIKMCKSQADAAQVRALTLELKIMNHLGKHLNIVNLMGANTAHIGRGELWILVEYCRFGNLLVFMHRHRRNFINQIDPNTGRIDTTKMTQDTASLLSPLSPGASNWRQTTSRGSQDAFGTTPSTPLTLSAPPQGHHASLRSQVHNPLYNPTVGSPSGVGSLLGTNGTESESCGSERRTLDTTNSTSDGQVQNSYYTSTFGSNASQPLSPTDAVLDSHGNPLVHEVGSVPGVNTPFTTSDLVCWAWQVAHGMEYLASRKVLHGDLAARNLLLGDDNVVKISDFGLSREMYKKDVYMKKADDLMPIKWISIEAIRDRIFSVQSDVWAFGVTLWEIFSLGTTPYPGIEVNKDFLELLEGGYRMSCPKYANQDIYRLLMECWEAEPNYRPSFRQALNSLDDMMHPDVKGEYLTMNDQYIRMNEERFKEHTDYLNMLTPPEYENMTSKDNNVDLTPHYLNMEVAGGSSNPSSGYVNIQSPEVVSYSNLGTFSPPPTNSTNHYLPMDCMQGPVKMEEDKDKDSSPLSSSSSSSSQPLKFTFPQTEDKKIPNNDHKLFLSDENIDVKDKILNTEHYNLITNGQQNT